MFVCVLQLLTLLAGKHSAYERSHPISTYVPPPLVDEKELMRRTAQYRHDFSA